jgi:hypothetical protein
MTLFTPLVRGAFAIPLLLSFASLGLFAGKCARVEALSVVKSELVSRVCTTAQGTRSHTLILAQAPGDLGHLAIRVNTSCRA